MRRGIGLVLAAALVCAVPAQAAQIPQPGAGDSRMFYVPYDAAQVVELRGVLGYQTLIEFDPSEHIENVAIGDSLGWQVTPNRKANLLFVKPMDSVPPTNMTVVTNLRQYAFELTVPKTRDGAMIYVLRFLYPKPAAAPGPVEPPLPQAVNSAYSYDGSQKTLPTRIFDDGHATYFQFREGDEYPAVFVVEADKGEAMVNSAMRQGYLVVDQIARGFVLRRGGDITRIFNDGFREAVPGALSPRPRAPRNTCWLFCR